MSLCEITIRDPLTGSLATVLPDVGFNCFRFRPRVGSAATEVLWAAEGFENGTGHPSGSGIPILFPFAGRLRSDSFEYEGRTWQPAGSGERCLRDAAGNVIHGYVLNRPWRVIDDGESFVAGEFRASRDASQTLACWPADYRIRVRYAVEAARLTIDVTIDNPDVGPLPCGLGLHPYFRLPLGPLASAGECTVEVPAHRHWEMTDMLPTGRVLPVQEPRDLRAGMVLGDAQLDDVLTALAATGGMVTSRITDAANRMRLEMTWHVREFPHCVVYTPPHRQAICIEPYTTTPDAFHLRQFGAEPNLLVLGPGESLSMQVVVELTEIG